MSKIISFNCLFLLLAFPLFAEEPSATDLKTAADSAYSKEQYDKAVLLYDSLISNEGGSVEAYYNLGCCHYRLDDMAHAVLNFERALLLSPGDEDIRHNLDLSRSKTIDKIVPHREIFLVTWWRQLVNLAGPDTWSIFAVISFVVMLAMSFVFLFACRVWLQQVGLYTTVVSLVVCVVTNICAYQQNNRQEERLGAIVMVSSATVRSTPSHSGTDLFVLHDGTRVDICDDSMSDWKEIILADGKRGWIELKAIERI